MRVSAGDASGLDDVGEFEDGAGDGEDDIHLLGGGVGVAFEVDAAVDCLVGRDGDRLQVGVCGVGLVELGVGVGPVEGREVFNLRGRDVEEDLRAGGEGLEVEVFGGNVDGGGGEVGDADVGA